MDTHIIALLKISEPSGGDMVDSSGAGENSPTNTVIGNG
jgi:hypothetical protein